MSSVHVDTVPASGVRTFVALWCSQWLVVFAAALTVLVFRLDIFAEFDSSLSIVFAFLVLFAPFAFLSPFAGALVDRYGHRRVLLASNIGYLLNLGALLLVLLLGLPLLWPLIAVLAVDAILKAPQLAALESAVPLLVPERHLMRANAPRMLLTVTGVVMGPLVVALALMALPPAGVILLECAAVAVAILVLRGLDIPAVSAVPVGAHRRATGSGSVGADVRDTWAHLRSLPGITSVLALLAVVSGVISVLEGAGPENVFAFAGESGTVLVFASGWVGMLLASIAVVVTGRPRRADRAMPAAALAFAGALLVASARPNLAVMAVAAAVALGSAAVFVASVQTILHVRVRRDHLGRAMGFKNLLVAGPHMLGTTTVMTLGVALVPVVGRDGVRSPAVAMLVGDAPGRSWALLMVAGAVLVALAALALARRARPAPARDVAHGELPQAASRSVP